MRIVLGSGIPMLISWGPDYTMLYNDAYGVVVGTKHPGALGRSCREVLAEAWDFIGPLFDTVFTEGQPISTLTHQLFTFHRKNYLEECYFAFSYSPLPDDNGRVGGVDHPAPLAVRPRLAVTDEMLLKLLMAKLHTLPELFAPRASLAARTTPDHRPMYR